MLLVMGQTPFSGCEPSASSRWWMHLVEDKPGDAPHGEAPRRAVARRVRPQSSALDPGEGRGERPSVRRHRLHDEHRRPARCSDRSTTAASWSHQSSVGSSSTIVRSTRARPSPAGGRGRGRRIRARTTCPASGRTRTAARSAPANSRPHAAISPQDRPAQIVVGHRRRDRRRSPDNARTGYVSSRDPRPSARPADRRGDLGRDDRVVLGQREVGGDAVAIGGLRDRGEHDGRDRRSAQTASGRPRPDAASRAASIRSASSSSAAGIGLATSTPPG